MWWSFNDYWQLTFSEEAWLQWLPLKILLVAFRTNYCENIKKMNKLSI